MAKLVKADGTVTTVEYTGKEVGLKKLQELVGGYIEIITLQDGCMFVIDEDGKGKSKPINSIATIAAHGAIMDGDCIVGDVVYLEQGEIS